MNTTQRAVASSASSRASAPSSSHIVPLIAFFFSGRSNVIVTIPPERSTCSVSIGGTILVAVGLNPFHQRRKAPVADALMVAGALLACVLLVLWALLG